MQELDLNMPGVGMMDTHVDGAGTSCNQRIERIEGTEHAKILRVPFRSKAGILRKWISRCAGGSEFQSYPKAGTHLTCRAPCARHARAARAATLLVPVRRESVD